MNSQDRREARYQRRKQKRLQRKLKRGPSLEEVFTLNNIVHAHMQTRRNVLWKASAAAFNKRYLKRATQLLILLLTGTWRPQGFYQFWLNCRGKRRRIFSLHYADRVVRRVLCKQVLYPIIEPLLIYDNGASREGMGLSHTITRLTKHLHDYYRRFGNTGYALVIDLHDFYNSIPVSRLLDKLLPLIDDDGLKNIIILLWGDFERVFLGPEDSQILSLFYTNSIDHLIKDQLGYKFYERYVDDSVILGNSLKDLLQTRQILCDQYAQLGIQLNEKKTKIVPLKNGFEFCKTKYFLTDSGKVVMKPVHAAAGLARNKIRKLYSLLQRGDITPEQADQTYMSVRGSFTYRTAWHTIQNLDRLFYQLFLRCPWKHKQIKKLREELPMGEDFITRREHDEFAKRMEVENQRRDDEDKRQNKRIDKLEETVAKIEGLTVAIEKMTVSIGTMATELKSQGERLEQIEAKPAKKWETLVADVIKLIVAALIGFALAKVGLG